MFGPCIAYRTGMSIQYVDSSQREEQPTVFTYDYGQRLVIFTKDQTSKKQEVEETNKTNIQRRARKPRAKKIFARPGSRSKRPNRHPRPTRAMLKQQNVRSQLLADIEALTAFITNSDNPNKERKRAKVKRHHKRLELREFDNTYRGV